MEYKNILVYLVSLVSLVSLVDMVEIISNAREAWNLEILLEPYKLPNLPIQ
jgi:hypothetical protein